MKRELLVRQKTWQKSALYISGPTPKPRDVLLNVTTNTTEEGGGPMKRPLEEWRTNSKTVIFQHGGRKTQVENVGGN